MAAMPAFSLFATAAAPVLSAGLLAAAGAGMAWQGALDFKGCSVIAALCFYVFTPALTFTTLAAAVSVDSIQHLWPLLVNMTISSLVGLVIGQITATVLRTPIQYKSLVIVAIAFGNVGNLPLVFVGALCGDSRAVFQKVLGAQCEPLGIAYTAFDICVATLFQFTFALYLLKPKYGNTSSLHGGDGDDFGSEIEYQVVVEQNIEIEQNDQQRNHSSGHQIHKSPTLSDLLNDVSSSPAAADTENTTNNSNHTTANHFTNLEIELPSLSEENNSPNPSSKVLHTTTTLNTRIKDWFATIDWKAAFPIPTQAAFAGVLVGCTPFLKHLFFGTDNPPLRAVSEALDLLGQGLIPGAIPLLGAVLYRGPGKSQLPARVTVGVVLVRLVVQPILLTSMVLLALHLRFFIPPDPIFLLTLLLSNATPTAINMQTLTVLYKFGAEEMSQMLFYQYICSLITLPGCVWLFLKIIHAYVEVEQLPSALPVPLPLSPPL
jgi:predicted permease